MKFKYIIITILAVLAGFMGIYFMGKSAGRNAGTRSLPNSGSGIPQGWDPTALATRIRDVIAGVSWKAWLSTDKFYDNNQRDTVLNEFLTLSTDDMFVATWNAYNSKYRSELKDDIQSEWFIDESILSGLLARFAQNETP